MKLWATAGFLLCALLSFAQKEPSRFGKLTPADLEKKVYSIDSSANAVYLADVGSTQIVGNNKGWFSFEFKRHTRIHILNKNGYDEASIEIPLYTDGGYTEKIENLKAYTYNLENGAIVETKFDKENLFSEKRSKNLVIKKFTLPNVKEGSIIDFEYRVVSDYLRLLQPWSFQGSSPRLWSEYNASIPQFLEYVFQVRGFPNFHIKEKKDRVGYFSVSEDMSAGQTEKYSITSSISDYRWVSKDVPAFKEERFTSSPNNYISRIEFQLAAYREPLQDKSLLGTWEGVTKDLLEDEDFGKSLDNANFWMGDIVKPLLINAVTPLEKAKKIFGYVRDNTTCTDHDALYIAQPLKNVLKAKNGRVSEINLLMTAMLKYASIEANPVILSTKDNGFVYTLYPMLSRFNYVICAANIDGHTYYLDASQPQLGFGKLLPDCYNGYARAINPAASFLSFSSDSLKESKLTSIYLANNDKGKWTGKIKQSLGYFESYVTRKKVLEKGKDDFFKDISKGFSFDLEIKNPTIDSLNNYDHGLTIQYEFTPADPTEDILYFNPMLGEGYKENPFKSAERNYPVEMPYTFDETYLLTMDVPTGYVVDELPKPTIVKFNEEGEAIFEYLVTQSNNIISLRSRIRFKRANFQPDEYEILRAFFDMIVSKQSEQIVFKKIKK
jgi:hypothetical protein